MCLSRDTHGRQLDIGTRGMKRAGKQGGKKLAGEKGGKKKRAGKMGGKMGGRNGREGKESGKNGRQIFPFFCAGIYFGKRAGRYILGKIYCSILHMVCTQVLWDVVGSKVEPPRVSGFTDMGSDT